MLTEKYRNNNSKKAAGEFRQLSMFHIIPNGKMTKTIFRLILFPAAGLLSCSDSAKLQQATEPPPIDSFTVSGLDAAQQVNNFHYINDSTLVSYDLTNMNLVFFYKDKSGNYKAGAKKEIDTEFWSFNFCDDENNHYFTDRNNTIIKYNAAADSLMKRYTIPHRFRYLKDSFALSVANNSPVVIRHDTLIAVISPNSNESERLYYKEQEVSEFKLHPVGDTLSYLRSYITKPSGLSDGDFPLGMYAFHHNTVFLIYPQYDTIYSFDRSSNTLLKSPVRNQDFTKPAKFACSPFTPGYGSCATKYYLHNFRYYGIHFNEATKHFLLFYNAPVKEVKGKIPTSKDQPLQAIMLDEQLRPLNYYTFTKNLEAGSGFFMIPGKGLAMPLLDKRYETTRFYIYNL